MYIYIYSIRSINTYYKYIRVYINIYIALVWFQCEYQIHEIVGVMNFRQRKTAPHDLPKYNHQILIPSEYPKGSMYVIFTYIWSIFMVNVGKYTIHGSFGIFMTYHPDRQTSFTHSIINTHPRWNSSHSLIVSWSMAWGRKPLHSKREMTSSQKFGISGTVPGGWNFIEEVC